jgi:hypothetical protein
MQNLMIALLVSLSALLLAAAGMAHHIWLHRAKLRPVESVESIGHGSESDLKSKA